MDSLDNIWNDPVEQRNPTEQTDPLFLADSDDERPSQQPPQPPSVQDVDIDIDAMFADVENADDPFSFKPLAPSIDTEALRREAEARHKKNMSSSISHILPSDVAGDEASRGSQAVLGKTDKLKEGKKERRQPIRLDEARLLGPTGFPKLIKDTKNFKIKGKGHEAEDLNRLLQVYSYWTHEMYPKTTFRDTVERVEKLCHSKRMHVALSVWRDEARGLQDGHKPGEKIIEIDEEEVPVNTRSSRSSSPASEGAAYASSSSHPPTRPPSSATEFDEDDFDIDAIIQEEERRMKGREASQASVSALDNNNWKGKEAASEEDVAMCDALDAMQDDPSIVSTRAEPTTKGSIEDEEMWDLVRETERDSVVAQIPCAASSSAKEVSTTPIQQEDDDDWDSVYV